ncbi:acyltransferase family protein [Janibacter anophelis]|uniref:acyltransferase family protein n=2 Tax=Janibacter TaxID=53457 RepID=UPI001FD21936|nr:acyltransferase family protein [Janibacter anophelis]
MPLPGGFVGVDVFFVISGYLIVGLLARELIDDGRISWRRFLARRVARLLPAALLTVGVTALALLLLVDAVTAGPALADLAAASAYAANLWFIANRVGYFAEDEPSPALHFWSLAVEEQFYLFVPLALMLAWRVRASLRWVGGCLLVLTAGSFALSVVVTPILPSLAYYGLPTRAWQLGLGACLALVPLHRRMSPRFRPWAAVLGSVAVSWSIFTLDASWAYPGWVAIVPTAGAALLLAGGDPQWSTSTSLSAPRRSFPKVIILLGDVSYSLYLWHWPVLVIPTLASGQPLTVWETLGAVALSVLLAGLTYRYVEQPTRRAGACSQKPWRLVSFGVVTSMVVAGVLAVVPAAFTLTSTETVPTFVGGQIPERLEAPRAVPLNISDSLASPSRAAIFSGCTDLTPTDDEAQLERCRGGDTDGSAASVALIGDSHAGHLQPTLDEIGEDEGFTVDTYLRNACPVFAAPITHYDSGRPHPECQPWREDLLMGLRAVPPDVIVVSHNDAGYFDDLGVAPSVDEWLGWERELINDLPDVPVLIVSETPHWVRSPATCLAENLDDVAPCSLPADGAYPFDHAALLGADLDAGRESPVGVLDGHDLVCANRCYAIAGSILLYSDRDHLTDTGARALAKRFQTRWEASGIPVP